MAMFEFRLPDIGEGVAEGEVVAWHVEPGQLVSEDQEMVEVMTDKATVTIGAPRAGRIAQLNANVGEKVLVGTVLVVIDTEGSTSEVKARSQRPVADDTARSRYQTPAKSPKTSSLHTVRAAADPNEEPDHGEGGIAASAVGDIRESLPGSAFFSANKGHNGQGAIARPVLASELDVATDYFEQKPLATPATRKLARDLGVDLRRVRPSGDGGRVTKDDVHALHGDGPGLTQARAGSGAVQARGASEARGATDARGSSQALEDRKPFVGLRRRIAERMRAANAAAVHATFVEECEVDALMRVVERLRPAAEQRGIRLNYLPFIAKAVTLALKKHPILNSTLDEANNELVYRRYYHVGIATSTEQGLVVPVVRDVDKKSLVEIAQDIARLSEAARTGKLGPQDLSGSTFTITSLGKQGGLLATPVLNYPEVGILGVHRVKERPVVKNGQIVIGNVMMLSLSFDHCIIDGHVGAAFAYDVIAYLENPELLLLELA